MSWTNKKEMSRKEKIMLLQGIKEGNFTIDVLNEAFTYIIFHDQHIKHDYTITEQRKNAKPSICLSPQEFEVWSKKIEELNKKRLHPYNLHIITITYDSRNDPIKED